MRPKVTEIDLIDRIRGMAGSRPASVIRGIGDDAAVIAEGRARSRLLTKDLLVEGIHFSREYASLYDIGRKAMAVNLSDIAAMGGTPTIFLFGLALPPRLPDLLRLVRGLVDEAKPHGAFLAGGDISSTPERLTLSITLEGTCPSREVIQRTGAAPGDGLYLLGEAGLSGLGLELLKKGFRLKGKRLNSPVSAPSLDMPERQAAVRAIRAHLRPLPLLGAGRAIARARIASAMIDTSDGISRDVRNLCRESRVGAEIGAHGLLPGAGERELAKRLGLSWESLALHGGEDYGLLFTVPASAEKRLARLPTGPARLSRLGAILGPRAKIRVLTESGQRRPLEDLGFDHLNCR